MKEKLLFLIILLPTILLGQATNHFNHLDSKWNVARTYADGNEQNPSFAATRTTIYGFHGDSLINNEQWFKLYSTTDSLFQNNLVYRGLTRTENDLVLYRDELNQLDTLYEFNLSLSDSVLFTFYDNTEWLKVISVDSIPLNGALYKRLKFAEPSFIAFDALNEQWIEGIGSIHGPLFPNNPEKFSTEIPDSMLLTCSYANNQHIWQNLSYPSCYINVVLDIDKQDFLNFKVYPNPFLDRINIEKSEMINSDLTILNSLGQVIMQMKLTLNKESIDLSELNGGIYFLRISSQKETKTLKIFKEY